MYTALMNIKIVSMNTGKIASVLIKRKGSQAPKKRNFTELQLRKINLQGFYNVAVLTVI